MAYSSNDLYFSVDGDYLIGPNGDLMDTDTAARDDSLWPAKQAIAHRLLAERQGWVDYPRLCAGLEQYLGQGLTPQLCKDLERQAHYTLTHDGFFSSQDMVIRVLNLGAGTEAVIISVLIKGLSEKPVFLMALDIQTGQLTQVM